MGAGGVFKMPGTKLVPEVQERAGHWSRRSGRAHDQRGEATLLARAFLGTPPPFPLDVTIIRISPGKLDSDNLVGSAKHVRDGLADWLGVDDGVAERKGLVRWVVQQRRAKADEQRYGVEVRVEART